MSRKTINIESLVQTVNQMIKTSSANQAAERQGMMLVLEQALCAANRYRGFRYLLAEEVTDGQPGVNYLNGVPHPDYVSRFADTDRTRVAYY